MTRQLTGDEFLDLFRQMQRGAFRLELRDRYNVPAERERLDAFESRDWARLQALNRAQRAVWLDLISQSTSEGKQVERVRVITEPASRYIQFEMALNEGNQTAGEDIRYLARHLAPPDLPQVDYWLFDSSSAAVLHFDEDDVLTGTEYVDDPDTIGGFLAGQQATWQNAIPFPEYAAKWSDLVQRPPGA